MRTSCPLVPEAPEVCSAETGKEKVSAVTRLEVTRTGASRRGGRGTAGPRAQGCSDRGKVWLGASRGPAALPAQLRCLSPRAPEVTAIDGRTHLL